MRIIADVVTNVVAGTEDVVVLAGSTTVVVVWL